MKLGQDQKVEFKKCFELDHKVSLKLLTTFGIKLIHFEWKKRVSILNSNLKLQIFNIAVAFLQTENEYKLNLICPERH